MSGHGHGGGSQAVKDLWWVLAVIVALFALWYFTGGPTRSKESAKRPFVNPVYPVGDGESYGPKSPKDSFVDPLN
jgi:hypothetical protein